MSLTANLSIALLIPASLVACTEDTPCSGELVYTDGVCVVDAEQSDGQGSDEQETEESSAQASDDEESDPAPPADVDAAAHGADAGSTVDEPPDDEVEAGEESVPFGGGCETHQDCMGETNYCVDSPLDPAPYCSRSACDGDESVCPDGWTCFNIGLFSPGEPYVCAQP